MSLEVYLKAIQEEIVRIKYGEKPVELYEPIDYLMSLGGKKNASIIDRNGNQYFFRSLAKAIRPAIGVEVFHNFTLMHDDIMDDAPLRRGKPTVHEKWNTNIAILSGDVMLVCAYELMTDVADKLLKRVLKRFNRTAAEVCEGQQWDMNFSTRNDVTEAEYIEMIRLKTSVLLGFSLELGGIIAEADESSTALLYQIGVNTGIGFQLKDDILDVYGDPEKFGKQVGGDIIENKKTWLLLKALALSKGKEQEATLNFWLNEKTFDKDAKVKAITEIYDSLNIRQLAEQKMNEYFDKGIADLEKLNASPERKQPLIQLINQLIERES